MDDLVRQVCDRLGVDPAVAKKALGSVLKFCQEQSGSFDFNKILGQLQGAEGLMREAETVDTQAKPTPSGNAIFNLIFGILKQLGIIAILKQLVAATLGANAAKMIEQAEDGAQLAGILSGLGIDREKGMKLVTMLVSYMKEKVDPDTIDQLTEQIPAVRAFVDKKEE